MTKNDTIQEMQHYAFSIVNNLSYGLFAIQLNGSIEWVNDTACRLVNTRRKNIIDKNIDELIPFWSSILKTIKSGNQVIDEEGSFTGLKTSDNYVFNAYAVEDNASKVIGIVITFRPLSRVIKIINKLSGLNAHFTFDDIITQSHHMKTLIQLAKTVADTPSTILITGESGTGKEVFAQSIHNGSSRNNQSFVAINCAAISSNLIESELFGYDEGAFTGASRKGKAGKFELANHGTIFLDEIGDMPLEMQVKLLRALQEKKISRVGGEKQIPIDIRIIAATNKDLNKEIARGNFRQDLYYRLNVVQLHVPPLRERKDDIPFLVRLFIKQKVLMLDKPFPEISPELMQQLKRHDWPGNVRELENTIEKLVIFENNFDFENQIRSNNESLPQSNLPQYGNKSYNLEVVEKETIQQVLKMHKGNITKSAKELGIGRNTLYSKINKYRLSN